ncbi:MAG: hypothetical protein AAGF88_01370 [Pseudomonadota bacterium]
MKELIVFAMVAATLSLGGATGNGQAAMLDVPPALPPSLSPF